MLKLLLLTFVVLSVSVSPATAAPPDRTYLEFVGPMLMGGVEVAPHSVAVQHVSTSCDNNYVLAGWNSSTPFPSGISPSFVAYHSGICMTAEMRLTNPTDVVIIVPNHYIRFLISKP